MKKLLVTIIIASLLSCNNPLSKVYTEEGFMLDMVEIRESNGEETSKKNHDLCNATSYEERI